jgi:hypothetical protein
MDRLAQLSNELTTILDELQREAATRDVRELMAPLAWLDEANGWLNYELLRIADPTRREPVPFTYIPVSLRK